MACVKIYILSLLCALAGTAASVGSSSVNEISVLGGQGSTVTIFCSISGGVEATRIQWNHKGKGITADGSKYYTSSNRLQVSNIIPEDEGTYQCLIHDARNGIQHRVNAACLYVLGKASFASCSNLDQQSCSRPDPVHVTAGQSMVLDTRVQYTGAGNSRRNQSTMLMQLFKGSVSSQTLLYACTNTGNNHRQPCLPSGRVGVSQGAQHKYDMNLTLQNAAPADAGLYIVRVEVVSPDTGGVSFLHKTFQVVVDEPLPEVTIQASGLPVVGGTYSLSCQITSSEVIQSMAWIKPAHVALLTSGDGIEINGPVRLGNTSILTLKFHPLHAQQKGNYTCLGLLQRDMNITVKSNHYVDIKNATVVNVQASVVNATAISLSWNVSLSHGLNVSHFNIHYKAVVNDSDQVIDEFTTKRSKSSTNAVVLIRDFTPQLQHQFQVSMAIAIEGKGLYVAKKSAMTMRSTVIYDESLFQVKVGPIQHCSKWMLHPMKVIQVEKAIREAVAKAVSDLCNCSFPASFVRPGKLSCRSTFDQVIYRSIAIGTSNYSSSQIVGLIEQWVQSSSATILLGSFIMDVDPSCDVQLSSLLEPECSTPHIPQGNHTLITTDGNVIACVNSCLQREGRSSDCTL